MIYIANYASFILSKSLFSIAIMYIVGITISQQIRKFYLNVAYKTVANSARFSRRVIDQLWPFLGQDGPINTLSFLTCVLQLYMFFLSSQCKQRKCLLNPPFQRYSILNFLVI